MSLHYKLKLGLAQINCTLGDLPGNRDKIIEYIKRGEAQDCDFIIFPELAITGYPVQDLIFKHGFVEDNLKVIDEIKKNVKKSVVIVGCITKAGEEQSTLRPYYNSAAIIHPDGQIRFIYKHLLPNYDVFDEKRYFSHSPDFSVIPFNGLNIGVEICEDLWDEQYIVKVTKKLKELGANCVFNINASPYYIEKPEIREKIIKEHAKEEKIPVVYLNMVGGQDEIIFDGRSIVCDENGRIIDRLPSFEETFSIIELPVPTRKEQTIKREKATGTSKYELYEYREQDYRNLKLNLDESEEIYKALVLNLRDYFNKTGIFKKIVIALSGGIDSSFTAVIACDAIGPENVIGILMPSKFSSDHSVSDAVQLCKNLGMEYVTVPIKEIHEIFDGTVKKYFNVDTFTIADENLQSRLRGVIVMYYSNKFEALVVSTGNKSELAVGYCTLYGDTNGGKNVPGDLYKVQIYKISKWINEQSLKRGGGLRIPQNCIDKAPSAELKENQTDQDSLPPYEVLDAILYELIENDCSPEEIIQKGFDEQTVRRVERLYYNSEYKRAQLAQTIKITKKSFGIGRRLPVINKYHLKRDQL